MDATDRKLLDQLQRTSKVSIQTLTDTIGISTASVQRRMRSLREAGVIQREVAILDPNREVEQSFWAHNITMKSGEVWAGVLTSENASAITLATQVGISADDVAAAIVHAISAPDSVTTVEIAMVPTVQDDRAYSSSVDSG